MQVTVWRSVPNTPERAERTEVAGKSRESFRAGPLGLLAGSLQRNPRGCVAQSVRRMAQKRKGFRYRRGPPVVAAEASAHKATGRGEHPPRRTLGRRPIPRPSVRAALVTRRRPRPARERRRRDRAAGRSGIRCPRCTAPSGPPGTSSRIRCRTRRTGSRCRPRRSWHWHR